MENVDNTTENTSTNIDQKTEIELSVTGTELQAIIDKSKAAFGTNGDTQTYGKNAVIFGDSTNKATGINSHAEGIGNIASGDNSHAEGGLTNSYKIYSHAEGYKNCSKGDYSHSEGCETNARGVGSHSEGLKSNANGDYSHASGNAATADGIYSYAGGFGTWAKGEAQTVIGKYNIPDTSAMLVVGNGSDSNNKGNAFIVNRDGTATIQTTPIRDMDVANKGYVDSNIQEKLTAVYRYKGTVNNFSNLPTNAVIGDVYNVVNAYSDYPAGTNFAWNGSQWDGLGGEVDLTGYALKSNSLAGYGINDAFTKLEVDTKLISKADKSEIVTDYDQLENLPHINSFITLGTYWKKGQRGIDITDSTTSLNYGYIYEAKSDLRVTNLTTPSYADNNDYWTYIGQLSANMAVNYNPITGNIKSGLDSKVNKSDIDQTITNSESTNPLSTAGAIEAFLPKRLNGNANKFLNEQNEYVYLNDKSDVYKIPIGNYISDISQITGENNSTYIISNIELIGNLYHIVLNDNNFSLYTTTTFIDNIEISIGDIIEIVNKDTKDVNLLVDCKKLKTITDNQSDTFDIDLTGIITDVWDEESRIAGLHTITSIINPYGISYQIALDGSLKYSFYTSTLCIQGFTLAIGCKIKVPFARATEPYYLVVQNKDLDSKIPTIDQTYSATSENPQSGVAVKEAISNTLGNINTILATVASGGVV